MRIDGRIAAANGKTVAGSWKVHTVFLVSSTPPLRNDLNQMVLHRPVETAPLIGNLLAGA
jgi:hypothetical protein